MIYIKTNIHKDLCDIEDDLKTIHHSKNKVFFFIYKNRELKTVYQDYQS